MFSQIRISKHATFLCSSSRCLIEYQNYMSPESFFRCDCKHKVKNTSNWVPRRFFFMLLKQFYLKCHVSTSTTSSSYNFFGPLMSQVNPIQAFSKPSKSKAVETHIRGYSNKDDKVNYVDEILDILKQSETSGLPRLPAHHVNKQFKDLKNSHSSNSSVSTHERKLTIEKQVIAFMSRWKTNEAVDLLTNSIKDGYQPAGNVVLDLLQQLAYLGEVDSILIINDLLQGKHVTTNTRFYELLSRAYCNSGRVEEAVAMLRIIYHRTRNFKDVDLFFTLIIQRFEHLLFLIEDFVHDLQEGDPPVIFGRISLWKCLMLTKQFDQAEALLNEDKELHKLIPAQVSNIIQLPPCVVYNKEIVLPKLIDLPYIRQALKAAIFHHLIQHKCDEDKLEEALDCLMEAMKNNEEIVREPVVTLFLSNFFTWLSDTQVAQLENWIESLDVQEGTTGHSSNQDGSDI